MSNLLYKFVFSGDIDEVKEDNQNCWLEEIDVPKDLFRGVEYLGPKIIDA